MTTSSQPLMAEVAVYPLREPEVGLFLLQFVSRLRRPGLRVEPGPMSTLLTGEAHQVWAALEQAFSWAAEERQVVLRVTLTAGAPSRSTDDSAEPAPAVP